MSTRVDITSLGKGLSANSWVAKLTSSQQSPTPTSQPRPPVATRRLVIMPPPSHIPKKPAPSPPKPNRPSHSNFRPSTSTGAPLQQFSSMNAIEKGKFVHREVELFVKEKKEMSAETKAMIMPLIDHMLERGYVLIRAEQRVKSLDGTMSGKVDLVFLRDPMLPNKHPHEEDQGMQIFVELKTGYVWLFDMKKARNAEARENILEMRRAHIRQVCCYMRMYYERNHKIVDSEYELYSPELAEYHLLPGGCLYYASLHKVIMVPKHYIKKFGF